MKHLKTRRCTNPLEPVYCLPKVEEYPPPVPKFIRNSIDIKDISGAKPQKYFQWKTRETFPLDNHGIEGSKTKETYVRKRVGNSKYDYIDYSDLTRDIFKTRRNTNPLDPIYGLKKNEDIFKYGPIEKSKPKTQYPYFYKPSLNLKVNDIKGSNIGSKNKINKFNGNNYELTTHDIDGCCVGSLKKGIVTKRCTNPLMPDYQFLGEKELSGAKYGEYSKKTRAKSVANITNTNNKIESNERININKEESKNDNNNNDIKDNNKEPKMVKINDIDKENNISENNNQFEEEKSESNNNNKDIYYNTAINFDREKFGKKPDPNFAYLHDPSVQSSESMERLKLIEKEKTLRMTQKTLSMSKTSNNGFFNNGVAKYKNNPNLNNFIQYQKLNSNNNRMNYGGKIANNLGGVGHLNIDNGADIYDINNENKKMNKTAVGFRNRKTTYEEKLDDFMSRNNLKYVESTTNKNNNENGMSNGNDNNNINIYKNGGNNKNGNNNINNKKINKK